MPKVDLEALLKKQEEIEARAAQEIKLLSVKIRKRAIRKNIGDGQLAAESDLLPLIKDTKWVGLSPHERQNIVRYIQLGIQDAKTIRAWEKVGRAGQTSDAEPDAAELPSLPAAAE